jgi:hypothetical protein
MRKYPVVMGAPVVIATFVAGIAVSIQPVGSVPVAAAEMVNPAEIVATQIRRQGYKCDKPVNAERDRAPSKPNEAVWVLRCDSATYRVRLHPDMAAQVERIN